MNKILLISMVLSTYQTAFADVVENVWAQQRPNTTLVDVYYDLMAPDGGGYRVSLKIKSNEEELPLNTLSGDVGAQVVPGKNKHIVWNAGKDWPEHIESNCVAVVAAKLPAHPTRMLWIPSGINEGNDPDFGYYALTNSTGFWMDQTEVTYNYYMEVYDWAITHGYEFTSEARGADFEGWGVIAVGWGIHVNFYRMGYQPTAEDGNRSYSIYETVSDSYGQHYVDYVHLEPKIAEALKDTIMFANRWCGGVIVNWGPRGTFNPCMFIYAPLTIKDKPVFNIDKNDAVKWCNARSEMDGLVPVYVDKNGEALRKTVTTINRREGNGYRMPTRSEWEYAARGGRIGLRYPWGDDFGEGNEVLDLQPGDARGMPIDTAGGHLQLSWCGSCPKRLNDNQMWFSRYKSATVAKRDLNGENIWKIDGFSDDLCSYYLKHGEESPQNTKSSGNAPVASFPPNGYGLYDIVGNAAEFVEWKSGSSISFVAVGGQKTNLCKCGVLMPKSSSDNYQTSGNAGFRCVSSK